jgi:Copper type II ascorbate-dependent monooxygenase, C-terminal domain
VSASFLLGALGCKHEPTYARDVAPILAASCIGCHRRGGVAPVPLLETFDQVRAAAGLVRLAVQRRDMPPWGADNNGMCRTWRGALWLPSSDIRTIVAWADGRRDAGDLTQEQPAVTSPASFHPSGFALAMRDEYVPGLDATAYRCFVVDPGLMSDRLVTAFRVTSSEPRSVAQVTAYALDSADEDVAATALDAADPEAGYTCYGSSRIFGARLIASWTWNSPVLRLPAGTGVRLHAGHKAVLQIHYNAIATGLDTATRTELELELDDRAREVSFLDVAVDHFELPAGLTQTHVGAKHVFGTPMTIVALAPRMHVLGDSMQIDLSRGSSRECVANFSHWNSYRQQIFEYEQPLRVQIGDRLDISCTYDTRSRSIPTMAGESIQQEQCLASLLVELERAEPKVGLE